MTLSDGDILAKVRKNGDTWELVTGEQQHLFEVLDLQVQTRILYATLRVVE